MVVSIPGPSINRRLFTLAVRYDSGTAFSLFEIQYRDLCSSNKTTFATFAKVPDSILYDIAGGMIPRVGSWVFIFEGLVYLQIVGGYINKSGSIVMSSLMLYRLDSVDPVSLMGSFTLVDEDHLVASSSDLTTFVDNPVSGNASIYCGTYMHSLNPGGVEGVYSSDMITISGYYGPIVFNTFQGYSSTVCTFPFTRPGSPFRLKLNENYSARIAYVNHIASGGTYEYTYVRTFTGAAANSCMDTSLSAWESSPTYWSGNAYPLLGGSAITRASSLFPVGMNQCCPFAVAYGPRNTYAAYSFYGGGPGLLTENVFLDTSGIVRVCPTQIIAATNLSSASNLVGIWGNNTNPGLVYANYPPGTPYSNQGGHTFTYKDFYVVRGDDPSGVNKYPLFSYVDVDGSVVWIKDVEGITPTLWRDQVSLNLGFGGRPQRGQLYPLRGIAAKDNLCSERPLKGQLYPLSR